MEPKIKTQEKVIDLRGVKCPMNFVKIKLVLANMNKGEILYAILDDGDAFDNVPISIRVEGHEVLEEKEFDAGWKIKIEKRS